MTINFITANKKTLRRFPKVVMALVIALALFTVGQQVLAALTFTTTAITSDGDVTINGVAASVYAIGAATTTGTITIGGTAQTGSTTHRSSTVTGTTTTSAFPFIATSLTSGTGIYVSTAGAGMLTGGEAIDIALGLNTVGAGITITSTGAYTGVGAADGLLNIVANALTSGDGTKMSFTGLTSGTGLLITSTLPATMLNTGSFIRVSDSTPTNLFRVGSNGHLTFGQTTCPVFGNTGVGWTAVGACGSDDTDVKGSIGTTAAAAATGTLTVTFGEVYATAPICVISPRDSTTATEVAKVNVTATTSVMTITYASAPAATAQNWNYYCVE